MEDNRRPYFPLSVGAISHLPVRAIEPTQKSIRTALGSGLEEQKVFAICGVISDRAIAANEFHRTDLALAGVVEDTTTVPPIGVSVLFSGFSSEKDNDGFGCWRGYSALPLAT